MKKWEYKVEDYGSDAPDSQTNKLNQLGLFGWELVAVTKTELGNPLYYLKMPLKEKEDKG